VEKVDAQLMEKISKLMYVIAWMTAEK